MIDTLLTIYAIGFFVSTAVFYKALVPHRKAGVPRAKVLIHGYLLAVMWVITAPLFAYAYYTEEMK